MACLKSHSNWPSCLSHLESLTNASTFIKEKSIVLPDRNFDSLRASESSAEFITVGGPKNCNLMFGWVH